MLRDIRFDQEDVRTHAMPSAFLRASTGIEALDMGIESLENTGYMHNHIRMYIAGICCNISGAHWYTPSQWMYYHLLDGDIASNTCSWQWNAGAFSSKKYITIQTNINQYTGSTQRKTFLDHTYDDIWTAPVPAHMHAYVPLSLHTVLPTYVEPIFDPTLPLCIYTDYWVSPTWMADTYANRILVLSPSHFSRFPVSPRVIDFVVSLATANIPDIQVYVGEIDDLVRMYKDISDHDAYIVDHILYRDIKNVVRTPYPYMVPQASTYCASFFAYWKQVERYMMGR
jgi:deoxyribodipyrimidine photo-lyase